jgi:hypothetical protein
MLQSKSLWLSNIHDQNDTVEFDHAIELIQQVVREEYPGMRIPTFSGLGKTPIFTCSLSAAKDLLSQWRGYCHNGGYCYSIQQKQLQDMIRNRRLVLAKCIYSDAEKRAFIRTQMIGITPEQYKYIIEYDKSHPHNPDSHPILTSHPMHPKYYRLIMRRIINYAPILKHEAFAEEQEWRIATVTLFDNVPNMGGIEPDRNFYFPYIPPFSTRNYGDRTIDYTVMPLTYEPEEEVLLSEVIISPTKDKETAKAHCEKLMQKHGDVVVTNSTIPYRNW